VSYVPSPAGFWKRFVAYFIDFVLVSTVLQVLMLPFLLTVDIDTDALGALLQPGAVPDAAMLQDMLQRLEPVLVWLTIDSTLGYALVAGAYFIGMEGSRRQATLGKQLLGIKVTARDGGPPGRGRVVGRFFAAALSWLTLNLGHALAAWTHERRALHDFLAGTRVENVDPADTAMPAWGWAIVALNVLFLVGLPLVTMAIVAVAWVRLMS
jgi:uncharacterized RDD family membrane protein YckC